MSVKHWQQDTFDILRLIFIEIRKYSIIFCHKTIVYLTLWVSFSYFFFIARLHEQKDAVNDGGKDFDTSCSNVIVLLYYYTIIIK